MNKSLRKFMIYFLSSVGFVLLASLSLLLIPLNSSNGTDGQNNVLSVVTGILFWLFFVLSQISFWQANKVRKIILKRNEKRKTKATASKLGLTSFFKNKPACVADGVLFAALIMLIILRCFNVMNSWLIITDVLFLFLSFNLHCILNGRNFEYIRCFEKSVDSKER